MTPPNPFVELFEHPVAALTALAYCVGLVGVLTASWWAALPNALYLSEQWRAGWQYLIPARYVLRVLALVVITMVDLWILAAIIALLT